MNAAWQDGRDQLERERLRIQAEITSYPPPIPACDAYFNYLLERRALVVDELGRLEQAAAESATGTASDAMLEAFLRSSAVFGSKASDGVPRTPH